MSGRPPFDPTASDVPTPLVMLRELTPAQYAVALTLNVLTRRENRGPQKTVVALGWLQSIVGAWAGMQRSGGVMRRDVLIEHLRELHRAGWLVELMFTGRGKASQVSWRWPVEGDPDPHNISNSLRGYGSFVRVPKAIAWDYSLTGAQKKVYSALHWRLYLDRAPHWSARIKVTHGQLAEVTGLHRNTVGRVLADLDYDGFLTLQPVGLRAPSQIKLVPLTAHYLWLDAPTGLRRRRRLWMSMRAVPPHLGDINWELETAWRVEWWRETGEDAAASPAYWVVPDDETQLQFDDVWSIADEHDDELEVPQENSDIEANHLEPEPADDPDRDNCPSTQLPQHCASESRTGVQAEPLRTNSLPHQCAPKEPIEELTNTRDTDPHPTSAGRSAARHRSVGDPATGRAEASPQPLSANEWDEIERRLGLTPADEDFRSSADPQTTEDPRATPVSPGRPRPPQREQTATSRRGEQAVAEAAAQAERDAVEAALKAEAEQDRAEREAWRAQLADRQARDAEEAAERRTKRLKGRAWIEERVRERTTA